MQTIFFVFMAAVVLLPLIPAFILFKYLPPGNISVEGPFSGLNVKMAGAFGGYFIVLLAVRSFFQAPPASELQIWTVQGQVVAPEVKNMQDLTITATPDQNRKTPDLAFKMGVLVSRDNNGNLDFPALVIQHPLYQPQTIHLDKGQPNCKVVMDKNVVNITGDCLTLSTKSNDPVFQTSLSSDTGH